MRRLEEACATGPARRDTCSRLLTQSACTLPGGREFEVVCCRWRVGRRMIELRCVVVPVGVVVGGRHAPWCCPPAGRRSCFDPCMPSEFRVSRLACGLLGVGSWLLQQFGWCMGMLAAFRLACSLLGLSRCSRSWFIRWLSMWLSRSALGVGVVVLSTVVVGLL